MAGFVRMHWQNNGIFSLNAQKAQKAGLMLADHHT
jgi:hypothetical protein